MRPSTLVMSLIGLAALGGCAKTDPSDPSTDPGNTQPAAQDDDGDGVPAEDDCDDQDASLGDINSDADCDGTPAEDDCDDTDPASTVVADDADCDGVLAADDCDDDDEAFGALASDADCDGVLTDDDCDDEDPTSTTVTDDADCDGVATEDDCDDEDPELLAEADDADCDGVAAEDDCDDEDGASGSRDSDADCDGVLTDDDCDDDDPTSTVVADDADCDGVVAADDCDDGDGEAGPSYAGTGCMRRLSAGTFDVGCTTGQSGCYTGESPVMPVTLTHDHWMGVTEVTQGQYQTMMGTNPSYFSSCGSDCPVEWVTWHMAAAFANAVSSDAGLTECYACSGSGADTTCSLAMDTYLCDGYRLPTDAEWEGAARCGEDLLYAGSNTLDDVGWYYSNSGAQSHPVATKDPNACGLYDMSGNVNEWTGDWYDINYYTSSGRTDPTGPATGTERGMRGGSWQYFDSSQRISLRARQQPLGYTANLGFRLARTAL